MSEKSNIVLMSHPHKFLDPVYRVLNDEQQ
jgi:hypothetical protein